MYSQTDYDGMTPEQLHARIANLWAAVLDVPRNGRDVFQIVAAELARLRDLLDRISTEAPGAIPACNCGEGEACNRCEIRHLLDIYNGRVPDGPYRKPVVNAYEVAIKSRWPKAVAKQTRTGCWRITDGGCGGLSEDAPTIEAAWKSAVFKTSPLPPHEIKLQPAT